jgi:hypothetical protein
MTNYQTNYQNVWGPVQKRWSPIDYRQSHILTVMTVWAWIGMITFFVAAGLSLLTRSDAATITMLISLGVWLACGISVIRIRRGRRKFLKIQR